MKICITFYKYGFISMIYLEIVRGFYFHTYIYPCLNIIKELKHIEEKTSNIF